MTKESAGGGFLPLIERMERCRQAQPPPKKKNGMVPSGTIPFKKQNPPSFPHLPRSVLQYLLINAGGKCFNRQIYAYTKKN